MPRAPSLVPPLTLCGKAGKAATTWLKQTATMHVSNKFRTPKLVASYRQEALVSCSDVGRFRSFIGGAQHGFADCALLVFAAKPWAQTFMSSARVPYHFLKPQCLTSQHGSLEVSVPAATGRTCESARKTERLAPPLLSSSKPRISKA